VRTPAPGPMEQRGLGRVAHWLLGPGSQARSRRLVILILFPALTLAGTLHFDFVFDDNIVVLGDPLVVGQVGPHEIFGSEVRVAEVALGYYRPLITLLYRADRALWGMNPAGYHLTNLLWHLLATLLVYLVALQTLEKPLAAWAAALLFSVLPAHTEAIGWIQGRVDLVSTVLALLTLLALLRVGDVPGAAGGAWAWLAGVSFLGALMAKESAAPLPLAWLIWEASTPGNAGWRERLKKLSGRVAPLLMAGVLYWLLRRWAVGDSLSHFSMSVSPLLQRLLGLVAILAEYGRVLLFPDLGLNFHRTLTAAPSPSTLALALLVFGALGASLAIAWRYARPLFPWVAWVPIMLLPPLLFVLDSRAIEQGFFSAERFLYLPSVGWCVLLGYAVSIMPAGRGRPSGNGWGLVILGGLVLGYAALTWIRLTPWSDAADLYVAMKRQANLPANVRILAHNNLGEVYLQRGDFSAAREELSAALRLKPDYTFAHNNLGVLLIREGRPSEAIRWLETAIRLDPNYTEAYGNLGAAYEATGDLSAARRAYEAGLRITPGSAWLARGLARLTAEEAPAQAQAAGGSQ